MTSPKQRIDRRNRVDLVAPKLDPVRLVLIARIQLDDIAPNAKHAAVKIDIHPLVLQLDEPLAESLRVSSSCPGSMNMQHPVIGIRIAETVDARHRCDDDHIAPLKQAHASPTDADDRSRR